MSSGSGGQPARRTEAELEDMDSEQLARLASDLDDVEVVRNQPKFPIAGTRAEKRAERGVAAWFVIAALSGVLFVVAFIVWPHEYVPPGEPGHFVYTMYTPIIGVTFGLSVLALGLGMIVYVKKFFPEEVSIQQRHDGPSPDLDRRTVVAQLAKAGQDTGIGRRTMIKRTAGLGAGVIGLGAGVAAIGGLVKDPWAGEVSALYVTPWLPVDGETVYLRRNLGLPAEEIIELGLDGVPGLRVRPEDLTAGSLETVFPFRISDLESPEKLHHPLTEGDTPVMLIRLRPGVPVIERAGQADFNYGDYYAYSKVCTHLGCPASLYESESQKLLCPCHQSQFLVTEYCRPVFGPATRALPQLPITVNEEGYFVATGDFIEPVGPAFWELNS